MKPNFRLFDNDKFFSLPYRVRVQLAHDRRERERRRGFGGRRSPGRYVTYQWKLTGFSI